MLGRRLSSAVARRRALRIAAGSTLAITLAVVGAAPFSAAQETEGPTPITFDRTAYFTASLQDSIPPTLIEEVPPSAVCILVPDACTEDIKGIIDGLGLGEGLPFPETDDHLVPQVTVLPGTLPVSMLGGVPRHTSYLHFAVPAVPTGEEFSRFELVLHQTQPTFAIESPAFRAAVLAAISQAQATDPQLFVTLLQNIAAGDPALAEFEPTGIEACAVSAAWQEGASQDANTQPDRDCILGATGAFDEAAGTWTFDLTFLAQAWARGDLPNEGIVLGPVGAENLAFGDPDISTNFQISLAIPGNGATAAGVKVATAPIITDDGGFLDDVDNGGFEPGAIDDGGLGTGVSDGVDLGPVETAPGTRPGHRRRHRGSNAAVAARQLEPRAGRVVRVAAASARHGSGVHVRAGGRGRSRCGASPRWRIDEAGRAEKRRQPQTLRSRGRARADPKQARRVARRVDRLRRAPGRCMRSEARCARGDQQRQLRRRLRRHARR